MTSTDRPTYFATKYDSARDEVVALLSDEAEGYGMRDDSTGEADAPTGYFTLVTIPDEYGALYADCDDVRYLAETYGVTTADVAGHHIVTHNSQGFVSVETFATESEARAEFDRLSTLYARYVYGVPETVTDGELDDYIAANPDPDGFV